MRLIRYRVADPGYRVLLNRVGGKTIGVAMVLGRHCYSWMWRQP